MKLRWYNTGTPAGGVAPITSSPTTGYAAPVISRYTGGINTAAPLSYNPKSGFNQYGGYKGTIGQGGLAPSVAAYNQPVISTGSAPPQPAATTGAVDIANAQPLAYDSSIEKQSANKIANIIAEGGVNPATGDNNIIAGPNVLSAADEGVFGFGSDYNKEFQENYAAQAAHAAANPTGQTTGTPLSQQGYVGISDPLTNAVGGLVNNSLIGKVGSSLTGKPLVPDVSSLLPPPPESSTSKPEPKTFSGGGADGVGNFGKVGDFFGGIGDSLGITDYAGKAAKKEANDDYHSIFSSAKTSGGDKTPKTYNTAKVKAATKKSGPVGSRDSIAKAAAGKKAAKKSSSSNDSSSSSKSSDKIVCTAMNADYGFGSFRNAIWLEYSRKHFTHRPEVEVGYHAIGRPLLAMRNKHWVGRQVYKALQHIARHRTADCRAAMQGKKRDNLGRVYRFVIENTCAMVGKVILWRNK